MLLELTNHTSILGRWRPWRHQSNRKRSYVYRVNVTKRLNVLPRSRFWLMTSGSSPAQYGLNPTCSGEKYSLGFNIILGFAQWGTSIWVSFKGVLHLWVLFSKTLYTSSESKAPLDKVSNGSDSKCSKELKNHSFFQYRPKL